MVSFGVIEDVLPDDSMSVIASDMEEMLGFTIDLAPLLPADPSNTKQGMDSELFCVLSKAVKELGLKWSTPEEPTRSCLY